MEEDNKYSLDTLRHSTAHIMAQAVKRLFPRAKLGIGPAIKDGFYYDFEIDGDVLSIKDGFYYDFEIDGDVLSQNLAKIEKEMRKIIEEDLPVDKERAREIFKERNEPYKLELLEEIDDDKVSLYQQGEFVDLCRGPHLERTGEIKFFRLLSLAGAYWRGKEGNPMLSRIYGTSFFKEEDLEKYLNQIEEAKKRDHRRIGKDLDLFSLSGELGAGLVIYHPKGALLRDIIERFEKEEHLKRGYQLVKTPHISRAHLWKRSGHLDFYRENMYLFSSGKEEYVIKPMNCPGHIMVYKSKIRSYRDLPLRYFELGTVYRQEDSGVLHGLLRVRGFTQDDAHIFCMPSQLIGEIRGVLQFVIFMMKTFHLGYRIALSTRPRKFIGSLESWEQATQALVNSLREEGLSFEIAEGEGAFYGPKIDIQMEDALGRLWQGPTIQVDFNLPERFDLTYVASSPFAEEVYQRMMSEGIRVEINTRNEMLGYKVREAQMEKIPYMVIIGSKEKDNGTITVRTREGENLKEIKIGDFINMIKKKIKNKEV